MGDITDHLQTKSPYISIIIYLRFIYVWDYIYICVRARARACFFILDLSGRFPHIIKRDERDHGDLENWGV